MNAFSHAIAFLSLVVFLWFFTTKVIIKVEAFWYAVPSKPPNARLGPIGPPYAERQGSFNFESSDVGELKKKSDTIRVRILIFFQDLKL